LKIELFVGQPTDLDSFGYDAGAHLIINNQTVYSSAFDGIKNKSLLTFQLLFIFKKGITVPTGQFSAVSVERQHVEKKPSPYSEFTGINSIPSNFI
jgi:hypothetical protein